VLCVCSSALLRSGVVLGVQNAVYLAVAITCAFARNEHPLDMRFSKILGCTAVCALSLMAMRGSASAHAPIEWSDPKNDAVVEKMPSEVKVRFAEDPVELSVRTLGQAGKPGQALEPKKISERTYSIPIPKNMVAREDGDLVMFIETVGTDGHKDGGVYLLHVKPKLATTSSTAASTPTTSVVPVPAVSGTTPPVAFQPPSSSGGSVEVPVWVLMVGLVVVSVVLTVAVMNARSASEAARRSASRKPRK
jgi:methionine-rich copper-binding protein CopC